MSPRFFVFALPALAIALVASSALAQEPPPAPVTPAPGAPSDDFGRAGQFALSLNHGFTVNQTDLIGGSTEIQGTYFVAPRVSLGLAVGAQYVSSSPPGGGDSTHDFVFHVGPRVGYDLRLADKVSLWPQIGVDYRRYSESAPSSVPSSGAGTTTSTTSAFGVTVLAPVVFHPTSGFFVGAGPAFYADLSNSVDRGGTSQDQSKLTSLGLIATIGGAF